MKKIFVLIVILFTLYLGGCDGESDLVKKCVKDYITSYENYDTIYVKDANCGEKHLLTEQDYAELKSFLQYVYNAVAEVESKNKIDVSKEEDEKSDYNLLTSPMPSPIKGVFNLFLENQEEDNFIKFIYVYNDNEYSLRISDSLSNTACIVLKETVINDFGRAIKYYLEKYCYTNMLFVDLHPIFQEINSDVVTNIEVISSSSDYQAMRLKGHEYFENSETINAYIELYKTSTLSKIDYYDIVTPGGTSKKMIIYMKNNKTYEVDFYQNCLIWNNEYYVVGKNDVYIQPDRINYSFYIDSISGELYNKSYKIDDYTMDLGKIKFIHNVEEINFVDNYSLKTPYGILYFMNNRYFKYDDVIYLVEDGFEEIDKLIKYEKKKEISYIENPHIISTENMQKLIYTGLDAGLNKTRIESLDNYQALNGESLAEVIGLDHKLNDEEIRNDYMLLIICRNGPIHDDYRKVEYYDAFVESKNLYITIQYSCESTGIYDAAVTTYSDIILIPSSFGKALKDNFEVTFNCLYQDMKYMMLICNDICDIKMAYKKSSYYPDFGEYEISILGAYGRFNDATALLMTNEYAVYDDVLTEEVVAGYEFIYPNSNKIIIYFQNNIYTLTEAYNLNFFNEEQIRIIYQNYMHKNT
ncbi:MAG: hypothetical protein IJX78_08005 [Bacilli bacterium]|nr:hypothetical protein [Bacilli bacterium]